MKQHIYNEEGELIRIGEHNLNDLDEEYEE